MKTVRIGTLACWLFGHKFITQERRIDEKADGTYKLGVITIWDVQTDCCIRCGIDKD